LILQSVEKELHSYLGGICNSLESFPAKIGGCEDHVHILCLLSKKITLIKLMEELKSHSSKWIKAKAIISRIFIGKTAMALFQSVLLRLIC
jgi:putative transposase